MRNKLMAILFVGALAIALSVGMFAYRSASAASAETAALTTGSARMGRGGGDGMSGGVTDEYLAEALGITVDELQAAQQEAHQAALAQAVEAGLITQAQADELTADGATHPFGGRGMGWLGESDIDFDALLADALGVTVEKLDAAREQAYAARLAQAVADGDLTQEQADLMQGLRALYGSENYQSAMQSAFEAAIQQAVSDGVITQAQADLILANQGDGGWRGPTGGARSQGFGGPRGHGDFDRSNGSGPHGQWDDGDPSADPSTPPAQTATP